MNDVMKLKRRIIDKRRSFCLRFSLSIVVFLGSFSCLFASQYDNEFSIPIYPSAKKIKSYFDDKAKVYSKSYYVRLDYPPRSLISFYSKEMKKLNYSEYKECGHNTGKWIEFEDISNKTLYHIHQFSKVWIDNDSKRKVILLLSYKSQNKKKIYDKLCVTLQVMPLFDEKALNEFLNELERDGKFEEFMRLLKKYSTEEKKVDFEKAIDENPNNLYLQRYKQIIKNIDQHMEE